MADDTPTPLPGEDIELPLPAQQQPPRFAGPSRATEVTTAITTITAALIALIFHPDLMSLAPPLPPALFWVALVVFQLSALDVAVRSIRGWSLWTPTVMIVCVGGGATVIAIALAHLSDVVA